jgi:hypothetical protein
VSQVFLSYSRVDLEYVEKLEKKLLSEGFDVWRDEKSIDYGDYWPDEIEDALNNCIVFLIVVSTNSRASKYAQKELLYAQKLKKEIRPLWLEGEFWFSLGDIQGVDVKDSSLPPERFYKNLKEAIGGAESSPRTKTELFPDINWKVYFESLLESRRIRSALAIESFIELQTKTGKSLEEETKEFLKPNGNGVLAIVGDALSGKTSFMGRIIEEMASNAMQELKIDDTLPPTNRIPVYIPLRGKKIANFDTLYGLLPNKIKPWVKVRKGKKTEFVFGTSETKWLIYLDGLDEVWDDGEREATIKYLHQFLNDFEDSQIKVILTSRPWVGLYSEEDAQILEVAHLNPAQMEYYLVSFINPDTAEEKNIAAYIKPIQKIFRDKEPELEKICSLPGYLSIFVDELPSSSEVLETEYPQEQNEREIEANNFVDAETEYTFSSFSIENNTNELVLSNPIDYGSDEKNSNSSEKELLEEQNEEELPEEQEKNEKKYQVQTQNQNNKEEEDEDNNKNNDSDSNSDVRDDIRIGVVVSGMYMKVWEREERRRSTDRQNLFEKTCELAAYMDGRKKTFSALEALKILSNKKDLNWLLNLGIIRREERRYSFYQPLTAVSFATEYLRSYYLGEAFGEIQEKNKQILLNFSDDFKRRVEAMFETIEGFPVHQEKIMSNPKTTLMR